MEDVLVVTSIRASWGSSGVTIVSDGWTDTRRRPLINIIATLPKGAMFLKDEDYSGEVKDSQFIANVLIKAIEHISPPLNSLQPFRNIAPFGEVAMLFISGLRLVSVHPSEATVTPELPHEPRIGARISSTKSFSFFKRSVWTFS